MEIQTRKQTGIRLPEGLINRIKKKARSNGVSFNAYVEQVLENDMREDIPHIDKNAPLEPWVLSMAGIVTTPTQKELEEDPRLAKIFGL